MIDTVELSKRYGSSIALDRVTLSVPEGTVLGLVGPNGAGKTTLLGLVAGLRRPTSGTVRIAVPRERVAVLPDTPRFEPWLTATEVVSLAQSLGDPGRGHGSVTGGGMDRVAEVLAEAGLTDAAERRVGGFSRGMLQRLGIASTLVAGPSVVLLDEPASALDPQGRREVLDLIRRLRGTATVLFSSHILADVQEVCDAVAVLDDGQLRFQGTLNELLVGEAVPRSIVRVRADAASVAGELRRLAWVVDASALDDVSLVVRAGSLDDAETMLAGALAATGAHVVSFGPEEVSLERAFLELTR